MELPEHLGLAYGAWAPVGAAGKVPDEKRAEWLAQLAGLPISRDYGHAYRRWESSFASPSDRTFTLQVSSRLLLGHGSSDPSGVGRTVGQTRSEVGTDGRMSGTR